MGEPIRGRYGIRSYWQTKVVSGQANITCELLSLYLDDGTAVAEWEAIFDDTPPRGFASGCARSRCSRSTAP
jgi:hypothetical protein